MKSLTIRSAVLVFIFAFTASAGFAASEEKSEAAFKFAEVEYFHRWSKDDQHEFTPRGQKDLKRWVDMVTINYYRNVTDGEALAATANAVLENYKNNQAMVLRIDSVPRTPEKPAEYLIVVLFPRPDFIEAVFARFKMVDGIGTSTIYSHRKYGKKIGDQMSAWLQANGASKEKALMSWKEIPSLDASKKWKN